MNRQSLLIHVAVFSSYFAGVFIILLEGWWSLVPIILILLSAITMGEAISKAHNSPNVSEVSK